MCAPNPPCERRRAARVRSEPVACPRGPFGRRRDRSGHGARRSSDAGEPRPPRAHRITGTGEPRAAAGGAHAPAKGRGAAAGGRAARGAGSPAHASSARSPAALAADREVRAGRGRRSFHGRSRLRLPGVRDVRTGRLDPSRPAQRRRDVDLLVRSMQPKLQNGDEAPSRLQAVPFGGHRHRRADGRVDAHAALTTRATLSGIPSRLRSPRSGFPSGPCVRHGGSLRSARRESFPRSRAPRRSA